jgi:hypothetical protein
VLRHHRAATARVTESWRERATYDEALDRRILLRLLYTRCDFDQVERCDRLAVDQSACEQERFEDCGAVERMRERVVQNDRDASQVGGVDMHWMFWL